MTETMQTVDENDLHAYADDRLDAARRAEVEAWLAAHPEDRARVADWQAQNAAIRSLFPGDETASDADRALLSGASRPARPRRLSVATLARTAAAILLFIGGIGVGRFAPPLFDADRPTLTTATLSDQSHSAFLIYASDIRHPVEVGADQQDHLATWLGKRLDHPMRIPDLSNLGMKLVGGRLVPVSGRPGALLMYEDTAGERITVLVGRNDENRETSFRYASDDGLETFYWIDGAVGYAVTGEISRERMQQVADECYRQFDL